MASRAFTVVTDDLDGTELIDGHGITLAFSIGTTHYEIDHAAKNLDKVTNALKSYTEAARVIRGGPGPLHGRAAGHRTSRPLWILQRYGRGRPATGSCSPPGAVSPPPCSVNIAPQATADMPSNDLDDPTGHRWE